MSNVPPSKREQYLANSGIELKSDDTQFDVVTWREQVQTLLNNINGNTDEIEPKLNEIKTVLDAINANTDGIESLHTDTNTKLDSVISELQGTLTVIATFHKNIHLGRSFMAHHNSISLTNGSSINAYFETPASNAPHIVFDIHGSGAFDFEVLEAPTVTSATGTATPVYNKNRDSSTNSGVIDNTGTSNSMSTDVTTTADGTVIVQDFISSGHKSGGSVDFGKEIALSASTKYVFRLTSRDSSIKAHINLDWYE
jgi:hypothetical protein